MNVEFCRTCEYPGEYKDSNYAPIFCSERWNNYLIKVRFIVRLHIKLTFIAGI